MKASTGYVICREKSFSLKWNKKDVTIMGGGIFHRGNKFDHYKKRYHMVLSICKHVDIFSFSVV